MEQRYYCCIDLKSFYASVECVERGLDPMTTNLVVADPERSDKTICLAVSPSLKELGIKNRCRVFEIPENVDYIMAEPRMQKYIEYSADIYEFYLEYFSIDDIFVYSVDEVFIDLTSYLKFYNKTPKELARFLTGKIREKFGVVATCGIGTNLYLAKIALDILAKHSEDFIAFLDEEKFKKELWNHKPLTDFWRIGKGICNRLNNLGIYTMGDLAGANNDLLFDTFGIDAELLIDHSYGREPVTLKEVKRFKPKTNSYSNGQVLMRDYGVDETEIIIREMTYELCLKLLKENSETSSSTVSIRYSKDSDPRKFHFSVNYHRYTNDFSLIVEPIIEKFRHLVNPDGLIRKVTISFNNIQLQTIKQLNFFDQVEDHNEKNKLEKAVLNLKERFGNNSVLRGLDLLDSATSVERHNQIGGHKKGA